MTTTEQTLPPLPPMARTFATDEPYGYGESDMRAYAAEAVRNALATQVPIDMVLYCPNCGKQHIDAPDEPPMHYAMGLGTSASGPVWENPPHRSHLCHSCGCIWRPADVPTNGVASIKTEGKADTWVVYPQEIDAIPATQQAPALTDEQEREAFKVHFSKWAESKKRSFNLTRDGKFADYRVDARWLGWKARALLAAASPTPTDSTPTQEDFIAVAKWLQEHRASWRGIGQSDVEEVWKKVSERLKQKEAST